MRLVDIDAMNKKLFYKQCGGKDSLITVEKAFEMIESQPTVDILGEVLEKAEIDIRADERAKIFKEVEEYCGKQRYLVPEGVWKILNR